MTYEEILNLKLLQEYPETLENYQELCTAFVNGINFAHKYYPTSPDCPVREWHNLIDDPTDLPDANKVCRIIFSDGTKGIGSMVYKTIKVTQTLEPSNLTDSGSLSGPGSSVIQPGLPNQDPWSLEPGSGSDSGDNPGGGNDPGDEPGDNPGDNSGDNPSDPNTGNNDSGNESDELTTRVKVWTVRYRSDIVAWSYYIISKVNGNYV